MLCADLKPDNLMITTEGVLKISDFSVAFPLDQQETQGIQGAPAIQPPEVASGAMQAAGAPGDIWVLRCCWKCGCLIVCGCAGDGCDDVPLGDRSFPLPR